MSVPVPQLGQALVLLACLTFVQAQIDSDGFSFDPDNLTRGDLIVWCIWTILYLILFVLCFVALAIRKGHRMIYAVLLPCVFFTVIECLAYIVYTVLNNNEFTFAGPPGGAGPITAMSGLYSFTGNIAEALFFLGVSLLFIDRYKAIARAASAPSKFNIALSAFAFSYFAFLLIIGLALSGLNTSAELAFWNYYELAVVEIDSLPEFIDTALATWESRADRARKMSYAYATFVDLTIFFMIGMVIFVFTTSNRLRVSDKVSKFSSFTTIPLYILYTLFIYLITVVIFSPSGVQTLIASEQATLAVDVLGNLFFYGTILSIVVLGFVRSMWEVTARPQAQYAYPMAQSYAQPDEYYKPSFPAQQVIVQQHDERMSTTTPPTQDPITT